MGEGADQLLSVLTEFFLGGLDLPLGLGQIVDRLGQLGQLVVSLDGHAGVNTPLPHGIHTVGHYADIPQLFPEKGKK